MMNGIYAWYKASSSKKERIIVILALVMPNLEAIAYIRIFT